MVGSFILQRVTSLPASASDARMIYNENDERIYYHTSTGWKEIGGGLGTLTSFNSGDTFKPGYLYSVDTSSSPVSGYTISSPTSGDSFSIIDYAGNFSDNSLTVIAQDGYTINGATQKTFSVNDTIASFIFTGNEWKVDIGGLSTASAGTSGVNFDGLSSLSETTSDDYLLIYDVSELENKKIESSDFLKIINKLNELGSPDTDDYIPIYDTSEGTSKKIANSSLGGGINAINIEAESIHLDDTDTGSTRNSAFGLYNTIDFSYSEEGAVWISFLYPTNWSTDNDISITLIFTLDTNDPSKTVRFVTEFWSVVEGETPAESSPDQTTNNDITTNSDNINKYAEVDINSINSSNIESNIKSGVIKLTRDVSEDNYGGTVKLIGLRIY